MKLRKTLAALALSIGALLLAACESPKASDHDSLRPFVTVSPSGAEVVCAWDNWNGRNGNEWDCEVIK